MGVIGIIGAMDAEVNGLIKKLERHKTETVGGLEFHTGRLFLTDVVIAKCGVGKVFAAMCAEAMIIKYAPSLIINTGVAGGLDPALKCADIVVAEKLCQHDMDTSPLGDPKGLISGINVIYFESDSMMCISDEFFEWRHIALERDMHFYLFDGEEKDTHEMRFHVRRMDLALLGLKSGVLVLRQRAAKPQPSWMTEE